MLLGVAAAVMALLVVPAAAIQGEPQRLMYVHVPSAWVAFASFVVVSAASVGVLLGLPGRWDAVAQGAAELGVVMTALAIAEGSVWGHSAWGVWWTWDPRLVTTAVLLLLYVGYLALRALPGDPDSVRRRAAVAGALFVVQVPVVHFSVLWFRTLHQPPTLLRPDLHPPMAPEMIATLLLSLAAFTAAGVWYVGQRVAQLAPRPDAGERAAAPGDGYLPADARTPARTSSP